MGLLSSILKNTLKSIYFLSFHCKTFNDTDDECGLVCMCVCVRNFLGDFNRPLGVAGISYWFCNHLSVTTAPPAPSGSFSFSSPRKFNDRSFPYLIWWPWFTILLLSYFFSEEDDGNDNAAVFVLLFIGQEPLWVLPAATSLYWSYNSFWAWSSDSSAVGRDCFVRLVVFNINCFFIFINCSVQ